MGCPSEDACVDVASKKRWPAHWLAWGCHRCPVPEKCGVLIPQPIDVELSATCTRCEGEFTYRLRDTRQHAVKCEKCRNNGCTKKEVVRVCTLCRALFQVSRAHTKRCSDCKDLCNYDLCDCGKIKSRHAALCFECRYPRTRCPVCGKRKKARHLTCSYECGWKIRKGDSADTWAVRACDHCGKPKRVMLSQVGDRVYCDASCSHAARRKPHPMVVCVAEGCTNLHRVLRSDWKRGRGVFCSRRCSALHFRALKRAEESADAVPRTPAPSMVAVNG